MVLFLHMNYRFPSCNIFLISDVIFLCWGVKVTDCHSCSYYVKAVTERMRQDLVDLMGKVYSRILKVGQLVKFPYPKS